MGRAVEGALGMCRAAAALGGPSSASLLRRMPPKRCVEKSLQPASANASAIAAAFQGQTWLNIIRGSVLSEQTFRAETLRDHTSRRLRIPDHFPHVWYRVP